MAPVTKRKKAFADDQPSVPAIKPRTKRQKTTTDATDAIETPPPTPKPAAAARGRKPNAPKVTKVNGNNCKTNDTKEVETDDTFSADAGSKTDSQTEAPAVKSAKPASKRRAIDDDEDDGPVANGQTNGTTSQPPVNGQNASAGSEKQPSPKSQLAAKKTAEDPTPVKADPDTEASILLDQAPVAISALPPTTNSAEPSIIRPTIEPAAPMEQAKKKEKVKSKDREKRDKLYQNCIKYKSVGEIFSIEELAKFKVAEDEQDLLNLCQQLVTHFLFAAMTLNRGILYKTRSYEVAKKLALVSENHILIYSLIENSGRAGVWMRPLEIKSNLHQSVVRKCVKELVASKVVQEIRSADTSKKTYISADVTPDDKHIGGGFMDEGKFDEGMINTLTGMVCHFIETRSWAKQTPVHGDIPFERTKSVASSAKHRPKTPSHRASKTATSAINDQPVITIEDSGSIPAPRTGRQIYPSWARNGKNLIPQHPAYYTKYPTAMDVQLYVNETKICKDIVFTQKDTEQLLQKMEFDGYLERMRDSEGVLQMREAKWRATKRVWRMDTRNESSQHFGPIEPEERGWLPGNGLSQVPCTRCPVKMKCRPGGVVSPETCKYLDDWLEF